MEILEVMKHPQTGVGFLTQHPSLPSQTFVSADAIQWLNNHMEGGVGIERGIDIMQVETQTFLSVQYNLQNLILLLFFISIWIYKMSEKKKEICFLIREVSLFLHVGFYL